jgi:hypothetical protein
LFVKGEQTIWIERPYGCSLIVAGPGQLRQHHDFPDESALDGFQIDLADRLAAAGWLLWGVNRQRRSGPDRRHSVRTTPDRRLRAADSGSQR